VSVVEATLKTPYEYATELKDLLEAALAETEEGAVDLAWVDWGRPALPPIECDMLAVSGWSFGESNTIGQPSTSGVRHIHGRVNLVGFLVTVARSCAPGYEDDGTPPTSEAKSAAAERMFDSAWACWTRIYQAKRSDTLFEGKCRELFMDGIRALDTSGTIMAFELEFRAEIYGIIASGT
jgi:hypothetical protein